jgi:hypothetical protein
MRIVSIALPCLLWCASLPQGVGAQDAQTDVQSVKLLFSATAEKREYRPGEEIRLAFSLRNMGSKDVLVGRRFGLNANVWLKISGPDGKEVPWCGKIDGAPAEFVKLGAGAKIGSLVRVSCDARRDSGFVFARPGEYVVSAYYHLTEPRKELKRIAAGAMVTTARIRAKPVEITMTSPGP